MDLLFLLQHVVFSERFVIYVVPSIYYWPEIYGLCYVLLLFFFDFLFGNYSLTKICKVILFYYKGLLFYYSSLYILGFSVLAFNNFKFSGNLTVNSLLFGLWIKLILVLVVIYLINLHILRLEQNAFRFYVRKEYFYLINVGILSLFLVLDAKDFLMFYISLELYSLISYILVSEKDEHYRYSLVYLILGSVASAFILLGICYIYGLTGGIDFHYLYMLHKLGYPSFEYKLTLNLSLFFLITGLIFKMGLVPYHYWILSIYDKMPSFTFSIFMLFPKIIFCCFLFKLLGIFSCAYKFLSVMLSLYGLLSMTVGSFLAFEQSDFKRFLVCSSIVNIGYILLCINPFSFDFILAFIIYIIIYVISMVMLLTFFLCFVPKPDMSSEFYYLRDLNNLPSHFKLIFLILMLSFVGLPPLAGFFGKFFLLYALFMDQAYGLLISVLICSLLSAYYYTYIIQILFFDLSIKFNWELLKMYLSNDITSKTQNSIIDSYLKGSSEMFWLFIFLGFLCGIIVLVLSLYVFAFSFSFFL